MHRLFLLSVTASFLLPVAAATAQNVSEQYLLMAANREREAAGLPPVRADAALERAAEEHAREMAEHENISHQFAGEPDLATRAGGAGARFNLVTENVAEAANAALIHDLWMNSAGHRANLLDPQVDTVGISVIAFHGQLYAVEDFSRSVGNLSLQQQENAVASLLVQAGLTMEGDRAQARDTCARRTGYAGTRQPWFVMRYTSSALNRLPDQLAERLVSGKYHSAEVGACSAHGSSPFSTYSIAVLLFP